MLGYKLEMFQEPRANMRLVQQNPMLGKGTVNYVIFSPLDKLTFEPDLLVLMATAGQAEIVLRAMTYSTGELYESKSSIALSCSWLYVYPFLSGKLNYMVTGMGFGTRGRQVFPEGWLLISIPFTWIPTITRNLQEMKWVLPAYTLGKEKFIQYEHDIKEQLKKEAQHP